MWEREGNIEECFYEKERAVRGFLMGKWGNNGI